GGGADGNDSLELGGVGDVLRVLHVGLGVGLAVGLNALQSGGVVIVGAAHQAGDAGVHHDGGLSHQHIAVTADGGDQDVVALLGGLVGQDHLAAAGGNGVLQLIDGLIVVLVDGVQLIQGL